MTTPTTDRPRVRLGHGGYRLTGERATDTRSTVRRLLGYLQPYRRAIVIIALLAVIGTLASLAGPILMGKAIDHAIANSDRHELQNLVLLMLVVYLSAGIAGAIQGIMMVGIGQQLVAQLRIQLFSHVQALSMAYHDRHRIGDLMSRISNDTDAINQALSNGLIEFTRNILLLGGIMISMFILNWQLAIGTLLALMVMLYLTGKITQISRQAFRSVQHDLGNLNGVMEENISGLRVIKAFAHENDTYTEFVETNTAYRQSGTRADIITSALAPMFVTMSTLTIALTALLGGWLALHDRLQVGVLATFIVYIRNFFNPMRAIAMLYNQLQSALAGAERVFTVLDATPSVTDALDAPSLPNIRGVVKFDHVSFAYDPAKPVLNDISLEASSGQTIALVGPTGAGKTTIVNLLSRFYDVTAGAILVDGVDIRTIQQATLRSQLGIVLQDTFLFSGTVMDNIRYGRLQATDEEVIEAAKLANADRFIRHLPQDYQTPVSEQGNNFSTGQRQLLAIARAILADPRILILDEATSSVDTRTEVQIQEALLRLMEGRTAFVIAHRLSTIRNADLVLVINDHRIIERGTHQELLAQKGFYHHLYMSQFRNTAIAVAQ